MGKRLLRVDERIVVFQEGFDSTMMKTTNYIEKYKRNYSLKIHETYFGLSFILGEMGLAARALATDAGSWSACRITSISPLRVLGAFNEWMERLFVDCDVGPVCAGEFSRGGRGGGDNCVSIGNAARAGGRVGRAGGGGRGPAVA